MAEPCCNLVGNLNLNLNGCVISVNVAGKTEVSNACGSTPLPGPTTGTVSITAYASDSMFVGCPSKAGVSISWIKKYDCENNKVYFIFAGQGASFIEGDESALNSLGLYLDNPLNRVYNSISASSSSGPQSIYMETAHKDGYGLRYDGQPIDFDTGGPSNEVTIPNFVEGKGDLYLQGFNLEASPGNIPTVSYSFVFTIDV